MSPRSTKTPDLIALQLIAYQLSRRRSSKKKNSERISKGSQPILSQTSVTFERPQAIGLLDSAHSHTQ
jgi:hypothetical protein